MFFFWDGTYTIVSILLKVVPFAFNVKFVISTFSGDRDKYQLCAVCIVHGLNDLQQRLFVAQEEGKQNMLCN